MFTYVRLTILKENKFNRRIVSRGKHYFDVKVSIFHDQKNSKIVNHEFNENFLLE